MRPLSVLLLLFALPAQALTLLTEDFPPLSYSPDGGETVVGISVDLLREALARTETPATIALMPWRNAYKRALDDADTCVFSASRTPEREPLFKWIGPLSDGKWVLFARADDRVAPRSFRHDQATGARAALAGGDDLVLHHRGRCAQIQQIHCATGDVGQLT